MLEVIRQMANKLGEKAQAEQSRVGTMLKANFTPIAGSTLCKPLRAGYCQRRAVVVVAEALFFYMLNFHHSSLTSEKR